MTAHDIPLSAMVTADEVIDTRCQFSRPKGIIWKMLAQDKIDDIPVLFSRYRSH